LCGGGGGATRPLSRDGGEEELHEDLTFGSRPKVFILVGAESGMLTDRCRLGAESGNILKAFETLAYFDFVKQSKEGIPDD